MSGALTATTIRDAAALARLEPAWWELLRRCPMARPFQSPAWLLPWWEAFHPGEVCAIAVHAGERLVALAPFYLERREGCRRLLPIGISLSDTHDVLVDGASRRSPSQRWPGTCGSTRTGTNGICRSFRPPRWRIGFPGRRMTSRCSRLRRAQCFR
jgi:CelD/BcsL family acetyltransferase involved in cellulose biosynthesis